MIIKELKKPITDKNFIHLVRLKYIKVKDAMILHLDNGTMFLDSILIQGSEHDDLLYILDGIYNIDSSILRLYNPEDVLEDKFYYEHYLPVNGGEYYTDMIYRVEVI